MKDKFQYMFITLKKLHLRVSLLYWKITVVKKKKKKKNVFSAKSSLPSLYPSVFILLLLDITV